MTPARAISGPPGALPPRTPGFFVWQAPGKPVLVHLHLSVVDRLGFEIRQAIAPAPTASRRAVCGVLLGWTDPAQNMVVVEDYAPLPCGGMVAPSAYFLGAGHAALDEQLERWTPAPDKRMWAVGYYRFEAGNDLTLAEDDLALLRARFSAPLDVMLLVCNAARGAALAGVFIWDGGEMQRFSHLPFPFSRPELQAADSAVPAPTVPAFELAPAAVPGVRPRRGGLLRWASIAVTAAGLATLGVWEWRTLQSRPAEKPAVTQFSPDLRLSIDRIGRSLHVHWNRGAPAILESEGGTLLVSDGSFVQVLRLDRADLGTGSLVYAPMTGDVRFRLELSKAGESIASEWVRYLAPGAPPSGDAGDETPLPEQTKAAAPREPQPAAPVPSAIFQPPEAKAAEPPALAAPPPIESKTDLAKIAPPQPQAAPPPKPESTKPEPAKPEPAKTPAPARYVPPAPIEIVPPVFVNVPLFGSDREVRVIVEIDATGKVIGAIPEQGQEARLLFLANQALAAARQSRFKPAQLNGKNVSSKVVLRYAVRTGGR